MAEIIVKTSTQPDVKTGVTLVHGLLTGGNESWSAKLSEWGNENTDADFSRLQYWEGLLGFSHQKHIDTLAGLLRNELSSQWSQAGYQHIIGHSNGSRLILECLLQNPAFVLDGVHLIATWAPCGYRKHINIILQRKQASRIFLYVSRKDEILCWSIMWACYWGFTLGKDAAAAWIICPEDGGPSILSINGLFNSVYGTFNLTADRTATASAAAAKQFVTDQAEVKANKDFILRAATILGVQGNYPP